MQKRLFPDLADIDFLGKRYGAPGSEWARQVSAGIIKTHCFDFSPQKFTPPSSAMPGTPEAARGSFLSRGFPGKFGARAMTANATPTG